MKREGDYMGKQRGISLIGTIVTLAVLGIVGVSAAKLMPAYIEYFSVKKMFSSMEQAGDLKGTVREIRKAFDTRNAIEDVKGLKSEDIEVTKEGGETVLTAAWSVKVPMMGNVSACVDFVVTTAK